MFFCPIEEVIESAGWVPVFQVFPLPISVIVTFSSSRRSIVPGEPLTFLTLSTSIVSSLFSPSMKFIEDIDMISVTQGSTAVTSNERSHPAYVIVMLFVPISFVLPLTLM